MTNPRSSKSIPRSIVLFCGMCFSRVACCAKRPGGVRRASGTRRTRKQIKRAAVRRCRSKVIWWALRKAAVLAPTFFVLFLLSGLAWLPTNYHDIGTGPHKIAETIAHSLLNRSIAGNLVQAMGSARMVANATFVIIGIGLSSLV